MSFLLDTDVISAVAPIAASRPAHLVEWLDTHTDELFLSAITVAEIRDGIAKAKRKGASRKASTLATWWETIERLYGSRLLPFDIAAARIAGELTDLARAGGSAPGFADVAIAAIAQARDLTVVTRNLRHFTPLRVSLLDPFEALPPGAA